MWLHERVDVWILANEFCNWYGQPSPVKIMMYQKQLQHDEYLKYLNSIISNDARSKRKINSRISMAQVAFSKKQALFTSKLDGYLKKKLVKCYFWSITLFGDEIWTLRKVNQKYVESFGMLCWRRMRRSVGPIVREMKYYKEPRRKDIS
jgi:hypothetical protein